MVDKDLQPTKVLTLHCPQCGELMVKFYPWSSIRPLDTQPIPNCRKCIAKFRKTERAEQISRSRKKIV